jgi:cupin fold WbuC family metalloprotein
MPDIQLLTASLVQDLLERARRAPRLRTNYNFHASAEDNPHRFLNVMLRGTYIAPHRHMEPNKTECFLALEGEVAFFTFDDAGRIATTHILGREAVGIDIQPRIWHTLAVLSPHAVCFEVKPGPYSAATDKEFAPWAPQEGDARVADYQAWLLSQAGGAGR